MAHRPYNPYGEMAPFRPHPVPGTEAFTRGPDDTRRPGFYSETIPGTPPREPTPDNLESVQGIETSPYIAQILRSDTAKEAALRQYIEQMAASQTPPDQAWGPVAKQMQREYEAQEAERAQKGRLTEAQIAKTQTEAQQGDPTKQLRQRQLANQQIDEQIFDEAQRTGRMVNLADPVSGRFGVGPGMEEARSRVRQGLPAFEREEPTARATPSREPEAPGILSRIFGGGVPAQPQQPGRAVPRNWRVRIVR